MTAVVLLNMATAVNMLLEWLNFYKLGKWEVKDDEEAERGGKDERGGVLASLYAVLFGQNNHQEVFSSSSSHTNLSVIPSGFGNFALIWIN